MSFDYTDALPVPTSWFAPEPTYSGWAKAYFSDMAATVEGPASATVDETGNVAVELRVHRTCPGADTPDGCLDTGKLLRILAAVPRTTWGRKLELSPDDLTRNTCSRLVLRTDDGRLVSDQGAVLYQWRMGMEATLFFSLSRCRFERRTRCKPAFWVMPLSNFVPTFKPSAPTLEAHPLRLKRKPSLPAGLDRSQRRHAHSLADDRMRLIEFETDCGDGFIDPLPDFAERRRQLAEAGVGRTVTAVMVWHLGDEPVEARRMSLGRLLELPAVLGLYSGNHVGCPFVELRGVRSALITRYHQRRSFPSFSPGRPTVDHIDGFAPLIRAAASCKSLGKPFLRSVLYKLVRGQSRSFLIEDRLVDLFSALDGLCVEFELTKPQRLGELIPPEATRQLKSIARETQQRIREVAESTTSEDWPDCEIALGEIRANAEQLLLPRGQAFARSLSALLRRFGLADADVLGRHYREAGGASAAWPSGAAKSWLAILSRARAKAVHDGYVDSGYSSPAGDTMFVVCDHLSDLVTRLVLRLLCYEGTYDPITLPYKNVLKVDWVGPETPASALGYVSSLGR